MTVHKLTHQSGDDGSGFSRWKVCEVCGASRHSGYWWLGGYKSKVEPPCHSEPYKQDFIDWRDSAIDIFNEDNSSTDLGQQK